MPRGHKKVPQPGHLNMPRAGAQKGAPTGSLNRGTFLYPDRGTFDSQWLHRERTLDDEIINNFIRIHWRMFLEIQSEHHPADCGLLTGVHDGKYVRYSTIQRFWISWILSKLIQWIGNRNLGDSSSNSEWVYEYGKIYNITSDTFPGHAMIFIVWRTYQFSLCSVYQRHSIGSVNAKIDIG